MACRFSSSKRVLANACLPLIDPHGLRIALTESADSLGRPFTPWERSPIPVEHQIRGLESARMVERDMGSTVSFLTRCPRFSKNWRGKWLAALRRRRLANGGTCFCTSWTRGGKSLRTLRRFAFHARKRPAARGERAASIISPGGWTTRRISSKCGSRSWTVARIRLR